MYLLGECDHAGIELLRERLERLGESVAIATSGQGGGYSVHVHADDAGGAVEAALDIGRPSRIQVTALTGDAGGRPPGGWSRDRAVLAIVDGDGAQALFAGEGAHVLRPDADGPISAQRLLRAIVDADAAQIMVLPNGYVAAEELVAGLHRRDRLGHRRGAGARGVDGAGAGRARGTRCGPPGRRRRLHHGAGRRGRPARFGAAGHRGGADLGRHLHARATASASPVTRCSSSGRTSPTPARA